MRRQRLNCGKPWMTVTLLALAVCSSGLSAHMYVPRHPDVEAISNSRPCLATVLLYMATSPVQSGAGILRLDGIPTRRSVAVLLDTTGDKVSNDVVMQWSPYSSQSYYVQITWKLSLLRSGVYLIATHAELVEYEDSALSAIRNVEPLTTALVTGHSLELVDNGRFP